MSDFDQNASNKAKDTRNFGGGSGLKAGVESGLSEVEKLTRGSTEVQQQTMNANFNKEEHMESGGNKNGKNFTFRG